MVFFSGSRGRRRLSLKCFENLLQIIQPTPTHPMFPVTNTVRFVLDGQIVEAKGVRRTTTVLDYLREELQRTGTKEGCAEGDCGACVVMVGELNAAGQGVDYRPINSCIHLLPSL